MTADDLFNALILRYPAREYALLAQVRNCTGFAKQARTADALCMSLWPSRGLELVGIEIKIDRRDWMREKADPEKADAIGRYCDCWWIATLPGVVQVEELPPAWGLMEYDDTKKRWKTRKPAASIKPKPITKEFLAAVLRNISETTVPMSAIEARVRSGIDEGQTGLLNKVKHLEDDLEQLTRRVTEFEQASGISIGNKWSHHDSQKIGAIVRQVLNGDHQQFVDRLEVLQQTAQGIVLSITRHLEAVTR